MKRIHTHYDNLKVPRDATPEVIRSAYLRLSRRYHPDRNPGDPEAERIMALVNTAYAVLSDPVKRREHDRWLMQQETKAARAGDGVSPPRFLQTGKAVLLLSRALAVLKRLFRKAR